MTPLPRKLKIGFVLDDSLDSTDGVQQYVLTVGKWFEGHGHIVHYLVGKTSRNDIQNVHSLAQTIGVRFNKNRMSVPLPASKKNIRDLLAAEKFDVLHLQMPYSPFMAAKVLLETSPRTAVVGTFHILPYQLFQSQATKLLAVWLRSSRPRIDAIVAVSKPAANFAEQTFGAVSEIVPNAVDLDRFKHGKRLKIYDDSKINVIFLGRLVERKGAMHLLKAVVLLPQAIRSKVRILICGSGPLASGLKQFVNEHDLKDYVIFSGYIDEVDKADYLSSADIAVFPSLGGESFGIVLVEAMAAGAVVLGGNNPGYASVLSASQDQLFDPKDTASLAKLLTLYVNETKLRKAALEWQKKAIQQYDVKVVGSKLEAIYTKALLRRQNLQ